MARRSIYPTPDQVEMADRVQIYEWYRFLPSPEDCEEEDILAAIIKKFNDLGGNSPEISKKINWRR